MTTSSFTSTDINFDTNLVAIVRTMDSFVGTRDLQPRVSKFEISNITDAQETSQVKVVPNTIPISLKITYWSFAILSVFFLMQFILTFFSVSILSGFSGLVGFIGFGGLFKVTQRIHNEVREKGYIQ
jgi:hypothetical protein